MSGNQEHQEEKVRKVTLDSMVWMAMRVTMGYQVIQDFLVCQGHKDKPDRQENLWPFLLRQLDQLEGKDFLAIREKQE